MTPAIEKIREEVRAAFAGRPYPGDDNIALRQPGCPGYEGEGVERFFRGKDWREITVESIMENRELDLNAFIFFLTADGFVYYLPALLVMSLDIDGLPFDLGEALALNLTPPPPHAREGWREQFSRMVGLFTPDEKRVVVHALEYLAAEYEKRLYVTNLARKALDSYWGHLTEAKE
jgi:hypothetical protein